jgi:Uma2 family endonuclease
VRAEVVKAHDDDEWYPHAPDLAVEVISPSDRSGNVQAKVEMWLNSGGKSVWVVDPQARTATVHRHDGTSYQVRENEELRDESVLPGFSMSLARVFKQL